MRTVAARASRGPLVGSGSPTHYPLVRSRGSESQQFGQGGCSGLMESRAYRRFDGFQIEMARFAAGTEDDVQQLLYFAGDFLLDRFGRFFS
jgi:hypothetical protein